MADPRHLGELCQIQVDGDAHFHDVVQQRLGESVVFFQADEDLIPPVLLHVVQGVGNGGDDGNAACLCFGRAAVRQDQPRQPVGTGAGEANVGDNLLCRLPGGDDEQGGHLVPAGAADDPLQAQAAQIAEQEVENGHQEHTGPGVVFAPLAGEQEQHGEQLQESGLLKNCLGLPVIAPLHNPLEGLCKNQDDKITCREKNSHAGILGQGVGVVYSVAEHIGQYEGQLQHEKIQYAEIQVLQPAAISLRHFIHSSLSVK